MQTDNKMPVKPGIFGGSFNPVHDGHIHGAKLFYSYSGIDELIVIPTFIPPHKDGCTVLAQHRLEMAKIAFSDFEGRVRVSDTEIKRGGKSYTVYTVREILDEYGCGTVAVYVGGDMLMTLDSWYMSSELFEKCVFYAAAREDNYDELRNKAEYLRNKFGCRTVFMNSPFVEISSSQIRDALISGQKQKAYAHLGPGVIGYIEKNGLYTVGKTEPAEKCST